jgi:hypothetical protein
MSVSGKAEDVCCLGLSSLQFGTSGTGHDDDARRINFKVLSSSVCIVFVSQSGHVSHALQR